MAILKDDFVLWRNSQVYEEFRKVLQDNMSNLADEILNRGHSNAERDMYVRGALAAYASTLEWEPVFVKTEVEDEEA